MGQQTYAYEPLKYLDRTIRLIRIVFTTPHVCCEFHVVSLEDQPVFSALSYMWGDPNNQGTVFVDGSSVSVTVNLVAALRHLYKIWSSNSKDVQWLWADAVCINQQDVEEENHQVPLIEGIY
jgi:hypothetical protein